MKNTIKTYAPLGMVLITIIGFIGTIYTDVEILKHKVDVQTEANLDITKQLTTISKNTTSLLHTMDKRLTLIEQK